jgi:hypothetical protein
MRSKSIVAFVAAVMLTAFGSSCRRVTSPEIDARVPSIELLTAILQIDGPDGSLSGPIRIRFSNHHEISDYDSPLRHNDDVSALAGDAVVIENLFSTNYMLEVSWSSDARRAERWVFGPLPLGGRTTLIDLTKPNLDLTPRLRVDGLELAIEDVVGSARTRRIGNSTFTGQSAGDSTLAFRMPPGDTELEVTWNLDRATLRPSSVSAKLAADIKVPAALTRALSLSRVYVRVNSRLVIPGDPNSSIRVSQSSRGDWSSISSTSRWRPGETSCLFVAEGPFQLSLNPPYEWGDLIPNVGMWAELAPGDTLDLDLGVLAAELRILDLDGNPVGFTPLDLEPVSSDLGGRLRTRTDDKGEASYLLNPGTYDLTMLERWTRRFTVMRDTLIVIREGQ